MYYVVRDINTGLYFRGKGVNKWGKQYNQASIYRMRVRAEETAKEELQRGVQAEVVPIQIVESTSELAEVKKGEWIEIKGEKEVFGTLTCSCCKYTYARLYPRNYCPYCGAKMDGGKEE